LLMRRISKGGDAKRAQPSYRRRPSRVKSDRLLARIIHDGWPKSPKCLKHIKLQVRCPFVHGNRNELHLGGEGCVPVRSSFRRIIRARSLVVAIWAAKQALGIDDLEKQKAALVPKATLIPREYAFQENTRLELIYHVIGPVVTKLCSRIMAHVVAEGEPKLAFACIDGTVARAHQKAAGARPSKLTR